MVIILQLNVRHCVLLEDKNVISERCGVINIKLVDVNQLTIMILRLAKFVCKLALRITMLHLLNA